jgi:tetratricopeptide (TPR) repeat protein
LPSTPEPKPPLEALPKPLGIDEIFEHTSDTPLIIESFRPLGCSLDWELGQLYYLQRGNSAFLNGEVPYLVNNDGILAARAAEVLFNSLEERTNSGGSVSDAQALEFGAGSCLFARGFLLAFAKLSRERGRNYHERLTYVVADHSRPMLEDAQRCGVFPEGSRVRLALANAVEQRFEWLDGGKPVEQFDGVFLNYLLDCLPATILRRKKGALEQLLVQTEAPAKNAAAAEPRGVRERLEAYASGKDGDRAGLIDLFPLFRLRCRYQPAREEDLPYFDTISPLLGDGNPALHSYAAIACLERCMAKLRDGGFVLFSDYRLGQDKTDATRLVHQHFGSSTAIGLNFEQLELWARDVAGATWTQPGSDDESLIVRLVGRGLSSSTVAAFQRLFDRGALDALRAARRRAREYRGAGAQQLALDAYGEALRLEPENWHLLAEAAQFCQAARRHQMALDLARAGLELNPIDPDLWNTAGDSLYALGRDEEAHRAFEWALRLAPRSVRARHNLVYTLTRRGDLESALAMVAEALAADAGGEYTDRLLKRQSEIMNTLKQRRRRKAEAMADRYVWDG